MRNEKLIIKVLLKNLIFYIYLIIIFLIFKHYIIIKFIKLDNNKNKSNFIF